MPWPFTSKHPANVVRTIWVALSIAILVAGICLYVKGNEADKDGIIILGFAMIALSFPLGVLLNAIVGMVFMLLDRLTVSIPDTWPVFVVVWLAFSIAGYWQWFVLVPFLVTKARSRRRG